MKRLLKSKVVMTLVALVMIAAAVVIPLTGNIIGTHAQAPASTPFAPVTITTNACGINPQTIVTFNKGDVVQFTETYTGDTEDEELPETLSLTETNGSFSQTIVVNSSSQSFTFTAAANNDSLTGCINDGDPSDNDSTATISGTITSPTPPPPSPSPSPTPSPITLKKMATSTVDPGGVITYTLILKNTQPVGSPNLQGIHVTDTPPSKFIKTIVMPPGPIFDVTPSPIDAIVHCPKPTTLTVSCTIDNFKPGGVVTISFLAQVFVFASLGQKITNTATAQSSTIPAVTDTASTKIAKQPGLTLEEKHKLLEDAFGKESIVDFIFSIAKLVCPDGELCKEALSLVGLSIHAEDNEEKMALKDPLDTSCAIAQPVVPSLPQVLPANAFTAREIAALHALHQNLGHQIAFESAFLTSINRTRTALAEGNKACEDKQLRAAKQDAAQIAELLEAEPQIFDNVVNAFEAAEFHTIQITVADIRNAQNDIAAHGLPATVVNLLKQQGEDSIDIKFIQQSLIALNPNTVVALGGGEFPEVLSDKSVTNSALGAAEALEQFAQS